MRKTLFFLLDSAGIDIHNKLVPVELKPEVHIQPNNEYVFLLRER